MESEGCKVERQQTNSAMPSKCSKQSRSPSELGGFPPSCRHAGTRKDLQWLSPTSMCETATKLWVALHE